MLQAFKRGREASPRPRPGLSGRGKLTATSGKLQPATLSGSPARAGSFAHAPFGRRKPCKGGEKTKQTNKKSKKTPQTPTKLKKTKPRGGCASSAGDRERARSLPATRGPLLPPSSPLLGPFSLRHVLTQTHGGECVRARVRVHVGTGTTRSRRPPAPSPGRGTAGPQGRGASRLRFDADPVARGRALGGPGRARPTDPPPPATEPPLPSPSPPPPPLPRTPPR